MAAALMFGVVASLTASVSEAQIRVSGKRSSVSDNPECPHTWARPAQLPAPRQVPDSGLWGTPMGTDNPAMAYEFAVPREKTNVPEFHDCQRLRIPTGSNGTKYGPLAAVFASADLDSSFHSLPAPRVVAMTYFPQGGQYPPLKMTSRFGCLVLRNATPTPRAWMVPAQSDGSCLTAAQASNLTSARELRVRALASPATGAPPPVARWDWDARLQTQYIGVRCGTRWCEVGSREGLTSSASYAPSTAFPDYANRGAYDEQVLAEWNGGNIAPGANTGTIVPMPRLATLSRTPPTLGEWVEVARIHMWPGVGTYDATFNFAAAPVIATSPRAATLSLCRHGSTRCSSDVMGMALNVDDCEKVGNEVWIARVTRAGSPAHFTCVLYRGHPGAFDIPPVVRWRWRANDETIWVSCPRGCCEVKALL